MKHRKRIKFRIWVWCSIALFLLIPLLSSPVAASFTQNLGNVWTNNTPGGPTAGGNVGAPATYNDSSPYNIRFQVEYSYTDSNPGGTGSGHWTEIIVYHQPPGQGWTGPTSFVQNTIYIGANAGTVFGTYTTGWITNYGGAGTNFDVYVVVNCHDNATSFTYSWSSNVISFTIT